MVEITILDKDFLNNRLNYLSILVVYKKLYRESKICRYIFDEKPEIMFLSNNEMNVIKEKIQDYNFENEDKE